jgi:hypothetical protein
MNSDIHAFTFPKQNFRLNNSFKMQLNYIISVTRTRKLIFKSKWNTLLTTTQFTEMCFLQLDDICIIITAVKLYLGVHKINDNFLKNRIMLKKCYVKEPQYYLKNIFKQKLLQLIMSAPPPHLARPTDEFVLWM